MWRSGWREPVAAVGQAEHAAWRVVHCPVSRAARDPEHTGAAQKAWRNSTPWSARCWMFGVGTGVAVGLHVAAGVVRVQVEDVGTGHSNRTPYAVN